jgi:hypothetical protein
LRNPTVNTIIETDMPPQNSSDELGWGFSYNSLLTNIENGDTWKVITWSLSNTDSNYVWRWRNNLHALIEREYLLTIDPKYRRLSKTFGVTLLSTIRIRKFPAGALAGIAHGRRPSLASTVPDMIRAPVSAFITEIPR